MPDQDLEILQLAEEFESCRKILLALGDETRQHLILKMMKIEECGGVRVGTITEKTHLSRPAVSHHLHFDEARRWYDGYYLSKSGHIYNPKSIIEAVINPKFLNFDGLKDALVDMLGGWQIRFFLKFKSTRVVS